MNKILNTEGILPAITVCFDKDFRVDIDATVENVKYYMECGCAGILVNGGTGEAIVLTREERRQLVAACRKVVGHDKLLIAGTGCPGTAETLQLTKDAKEEGADAVLVISPYMSLPNTAGVIQHYEAVSKIGLPIVIYNTPAQTGVDLDAKLFERLLEIENVVGIKESGGNLQLFADMYAANKRNFVWFTGLDTLFFPAFAMGANACILALANIAPKQLVEVYNAVKAGDYERAKKIYYSLVPIGKVMLKPTNFAGYVKEAVRLLGRPSSAPRPPLLPVTPEESDEIKAALIHAGLLT